MTRLYNPPLGAGLVFLGKALQTVRRFFRDRVPPSACHQHMSPRQVTYEPSQISYNFEVEPSTHAATEPK